MKRNRLIKILAMLLTISLVLIACSAEESGYSQDTEEDLVNNEEVIVHFIDVGQGDSMLIQFPDGQVSLIDGGTRKAEEKVVKYLNRLGIEKIDYLIATHPHEDHIGGLPGVIRNFEIGKIYMPNRSATTNIFEELLTEIKEKDLKITIADGADTIIDKNNIKFEILGPNRDDYSNTNDYSIVIKLDYKDNSFLFTGDMEKPAEDDLLDIGYDLKSDVLKVGHHGGRTSSSQEFLESVAPDYSIISLEKDNSYGHPHSETLNRLKKIGTNILRTDELGDIVFASDGENLTINEMDLTDNTAKEEKVYIGNKNTKIFHGEDCGALPKEDNRIFFNSHDEAIKSGYKPHKICTEGDN